MFFFHESVFKFIGCQSVTLLVLGSNPGRAWFSWSPDCPMSYQRVRTNKQLKFSEVAKAAKALLEPSVCNGTAGSNVQSQYPHAGDICAMLKSGRPPEVILQLLVEGARGGRSHRDATVRTSHSVIELPTHVQLEVSVVYCAILPDCPI